MDRYDWVSTAETDRAATAAEVMKPLEQRIEKYG